MSNIIKLDKFVPREYQMPLIKSFEEGKLRRYMAIWPRRAGKDLCAFNLLIRAALRRVGTYFYIFPTYSSARKILWNCIDIQGNRVIEYYLPEEIVKVKQEQQMRITLTNGSQIQILGSDDVDKTLVGTNAVGMIFSEYALQDPRAWSLSIPILRASDGWALFISTVRGKNHFFDLFQVANGNKDWFCEKLTIENTKHISIQQIEEDIKSGEISKDLAMQEYWNNWELGVDGSFYGRIVEELYRNNQITPVQWEPYLPVYTAWDIGFSDDTCILFVQLHSNQIRIIDFYSNSKMGLDHYAKVIKEKPYTYGKHIGPFDLAVHDLSTGVSRWRMMNELGITFMRYTDDLPRIADGIEQVRRHLPKFWIDDKIGKPIVKALENYREDKNEKLGTFKQKPVHDKFSHIADAVRYLCVALPKLSNTNNPQELAKRYNQAVLGTDTSLPKFFQSNNEQFPSY